MNKTFLACLIAWLIPGGGHMFLRKWDRGLIYLPLVLILFVTGLSMDGKLFSLEPGFFGILRFIADGATGLFYFTGKLLGTGPGIYYPLVMNTGIPFFIQPALSICC